MADSKRSWKLQDFMAHNANVNCLALGHKSGRVMVTGGDDKKVNLWAVGKQSCFMSLSGHLTPIECVQFNQLEELVCAGSRAGALKVWDLEAAKLVRTLNGHKNTIKCIDFHPYGDMLTSGSGDASIKMWDTRKKGVIYSYNGHQGTVNSVKFSPDGHWIASGGDDASIKIWDLRVGRVLKEFNDHLNAVTCVEFHPHDFLLATGSLDRTVHFFDLENMSLVSTESDIGAVRCLHFNPDGECLFTGVRDYLKIIGWEPSRLHDTVPVSWSRVCDISTAQNQLVGASFYLTNVQVYVVDLKKCAPLGTMGDGLESSFDNKITSPFSQNNSLRKSFSKAERPVSLKGRCPDVKTIEENTSGTDPEEETLADIVNVKDYKEIFRGRDRLSRTPPPIPEPFQEPERDYSNSPVRDTYIDPTAPQILGDMLPQPPTAYHHPTGPQILGDMITDNFEALSLDNNFSDYHIVKPASPRAPPAMSPNQYTRSKSNLDQVYLSRLSKQQDRENSQPNNNNASNNKTKLLPKFNLSRQSSVKDEKSTNFSKNTGGGIKHSYSEANINNKGAASKSASRKNSFSRPARNSSVPNVNVNIPPKPTANSARASILDKPRSISVSQEPVDIYLSKNARNGTHDIFVASKLTPEDNSPMEAREFVPTLVDRPVGLEMDEFLPKNHSFGFEGTLPEMSEAECISVLNKGHQTMCSILTTRARSMRLIFNQFRNKGLKGAVETVVAMDDISVFVDVLNVINSRYSSWSLDLCVILLPKLLEVLQSKYEQYMTVGCNSLKVILKHFGPVIRSNIQAPCGSFGVDIPREERYQKSLKCHELLSQMRACVIKKQTLPGNVGAAFREVEALMLNCLD